MWVDAGEGKTNGWAEGEGGERRKKKRGKEGKTAGEEERRRRRMMRASGKWRMRGCGWERLLESGCRVFHAPTTNTTDGRTGGRIWMRVECRDGGGRGARASHLTGLRPVRGADGARPDREGERGAHNKKQTKEEEARLREDATTAAAAAGIGHRAGGPRCLCARRSDRDEIARGRMEGREAEE